MYKMTTTQSKRLAFLKACHGIKAILVRAALVLCITASPVVAAESMSASSSPLNLHELSNEQAVELHIKMMGSLEPAVVYTWFSGHLWGVVPGTTPKPLVSFQGIAKSVWRHEGDQITKQSYDIGYFGDAETGEVLNSFENPYTGKTVAPYHYAYGGGVTRYAKTGVVTDGKVKPIEHKWTVSGDQTWFEETNSVTIPTLFESEEWPLASAGKEMHFGSSTTNTAKISDLFDPQKTNIPYTLFWTAINSWEPWLHMADAPGYVMWRATGRKLADLSEAPKSIIDYVRKTQPNYFSDDQPWEGRRSTYTDYKRDRKSESAPKK